MEGGVRLSRAAWPAVALLLAATSIGAWWAMGPQGAPTWGWVAQPCVPLQQPCVPSEQPWRWWTAAVVHVNGAHLQANLWATLVVAAWGWTARAGMPQAMAWLLAWPLAQALLATDPGTLSRYAGLSATLHAGVAIVCWQLLRHGQGARRAVGAAVAMAVAIKLALEVPVLRALWSGTPAVDQALTPLPDAPGHVLAGHAHGCGVWAGLMAAALVDGIMSWLKHRPHRSTP